MIEYTPERAPTPAYSEVPNKRPLTFINFDFFHPTWSNFDEKSVISCEVMILYLYFVVRITLNVQILILDLALPPMRFTSHNHLRPLRLLCPPFLGSKKDIYFLF